MTRLGSTDSHRIQVCLRIGSGSSVGLIALAKTSTDIPVGHYLAFLMYHGGEATGVSILFFLTVTHSKVGLRFGAI